MASARWRKVSRRRSNSCSQREGGDDLAGAARAAALAGGWRDGGLTLGIGRAARKAGIGELEVRRCCALVNDLAEGGPDKFRQMGFLGVEAIGGVH